MLAVFNKLQDLRYSSSSSSRLQSNTVWVQNEHPDIINVHFDLTTSSGIATMYRNICGADSISRLRSSNISIIKIDSVDVELKE